MRWDLRRLGALRAVERAGFAVVRRRRAYRRLVGIVYIMSAAIRWCFTINNYTDGEVEAIKANAVQMRYIIYGLEVGEEKGTEHLQGYCELKTKLRLTSVKKLIGERAHLEVAAGTAEENIAYCSKDGKTWTYGETVKKGARTDLDKARKLAEENGMRAVTSVCNYQQIKTAEKYLEYNEEERDWVPTVYWFHGPTGTGKSRTAREICPSDDTYVKNDASKWWTGYDAHEFVIIDDFRATWWSFTEMLRILDRYACRVETKGGQRQLLAKTIVVTSADSPEKCYGLCLESLRQLLRRITEVRSFA